MAGWARPLWSEGRNISWGRGGKVAKSLTSSLCSVNSNFQHTFSPTAAIRQLQSVAAGSGPQFTVLVRVCFYKWVLPRYWRGKSFCVNTEQKDDNWKEFSSAESTGTAGGNRLVSGLVLDVAEQLRCPGSVWQIEAGTKQALLDIFSTQEVLSIIASGLQRLFKKNPIRLIWFPMIHLTLFFFFSIVSLRIKSAVGRSYQWRLTEQERKWGIISCFLSQQDQLLSSVHYSVHPTEDDTRKRFKVCLFGKRW